MNERPRDASGRFMAREAERMAPPHQPEHPSAVNGLNINWREPSPLQSASNSLLEHYHHPYYANSHIDRTVTRALRDTDQSSDQSSVHSWAHITEISNPLSSARPSPVRQPPYGDPDPGDDDPDSGSGGGGGDTPRGNGFPGGGGSPGRPGGPGGPG